MNPLKGILQRVTPALVLLAAVRSGALTIDLEAVLDPATKQIRGRETLRWTNTTDTPALFIPFHLYMNAFAGPGTVFMKESGGHHRYFDVDLDDPSSFGGCDVFKVTMDGTDRTKAFQTLSLLKDPARYGLFWPDEVSPFKGPDDTIGVLELDTPVQPGATVEIRLEFITHLPKIFARAGHYRTFFMAGQWFPKIAVYEGAKGWNCHLFHADSEFFADFSDYTLRVDVPEGFIVGATGVQMGDELKNGRRRVQFKADCVLDVAFTAWDKFIIARDRWRNVDLILLHPPGNASTAPRQFTAMKAALAVRGVRNLRSPGLQPPRGVAQDIGKPHRQGSHAPRLYRLRRTLEIPPSRTGRFLRRGAGDRRERGRTVPAPRARDGTEVGFRRAFGCV
jgi:hypothetical protein